MDYEKKFEASKCDKGVYLEFLPRHISEIEINIEDVRASDGIQVKYDLDRDGWVILQEKTKGKYHEAVSEGWHEVGFFQSWALEDNS